MHATVRRAIHTALLTGGLVVAGSVAAHAAEDDGLLAGLGIQAPVDVSVDVSGLAAGLLGDATVTGAGGAPADPAPAPTAPVPGGSAGGAVSGTEVATPVHVPVDVSAVAVGVLGDAAVTSTGSSTAPAADAPQATVTGGEADGIASGTGVAAPISVPITVGDLALGVLGDSAVTGPSGTGSTTGTGTTGVPAATVGDGSGDGILADLGLALPISVPVTVGDLALGVGGDATVTDPATPAADPGTTTPGTAPGTGTTPGGTATPVSAGSAAVLAAADLAAAVDATAAAGVRTTPAALAPTGAPAAVLCLTATALVALGLLLRRLPRTAL